MDTKEFYDELIYGEEAPTVELGTRMINYLGIDEKELKEKKVLEIGVGRGNWSLALDKFSGEYFGLDLSTKTIENLKNKVNGTLLVGDITNLPFDSESFDYVFCIGVLPVVKDQEKAFNEITRVTKKDGMICLFLYGRVHPRNLFRWIVFQLFKNKEWKEKLKICRIIKRTERFKIPGFISFHGYTENMLMDWYFAPVQRKHTFPEIKSWCDKAGTKKPKFIANPMGPGTDVYKKLGELPLLGHFLSPDFYVLIRK